jgi:excinuclease ABC subunit A
MAVATGTPEEVAADPASHTGRFLSELLTPTIRAKKPPARERRAKAAAAA